MARAWRSDGHIMDEEYWSRKETGQHRQNPIFGDVESTDQQEMTIRAQSNLSLRRGNEGTRLQGSSLRSSPHFPSLDIGAGPQPPLGISLHVHYLRISGCPHPYLPDDTIPPLVREARYRFSCSKNQKPPSCVCHWGPQLVTPSPSGHSASSLRERQRSTTSGINIEVAGIPHWIGHQSRSAGRSAWYRPGVSDVRSLRHAGRISTTLDMPTAMYRPNSNLDGDAPQPRLGPARSPQGDFMSPASRTRASSGSRANGVGVQVDDTRICVVMVGLPARGKSLIAQKGW